MKSSLSSVSKEIDKQENSWNKISKNSILQGINLKLQERKWNL